jgi:hypothetical protein
MLPNTTSCGAGAEAVCGGGLGLRVCNRYFWRMHDPPFVSTGTFTVLTNCTKNVELLLQFGLYQYLQMALYFIIGKPIHIHKLSNLLRCGNCINANQTLQANAVSSLQQISFIYVTLHWEIALTTLHFEENFRTKPLQTPTTTC